MYHELDILGRCRVPPKHNRSTRQKKSRGLLGSEAGTGVPRECTSEMCQETSLEESLATEIGPIGPIGLLGRTRPVDHSRRPIGPIGPYWSYALESPHGPSRVEITGCVVERDRGSRRRSYFRRKNWKDRGRRMRPPGKCGRTCEHRRLCVHEADVTDPGSIKSAIAGDA
jgi:hypothetical protein